jgi:1,4-dihydroxy-2-naphthoate octaprenyltransferase
VTIGANRWVLGSRPRTLPASVVPVVVGTAAAFRLGHAVSWWRAVLAGVVALALQVGTNYANDYSDGVRGTDDARVGPVRLVASGLAPARAVKAAAFAAFGVAALAGAALALVTTPWLFAVGAAAILAGWFYTGGPRPYGYLGFGEVFVFVFFGLVATAGSAFVQVERVSGLALAAGAAMGCQSTALLVVNNLRDIPTDRAAGKRTLAVRLGDARTRLVYVGLLAAAFALAVAMAFVRPGALAALAALPVAVTAVRLVRGGASGPALIPVLGATARVQLVSGLLLAIGLGLTG